MLKILTYPTLFGISTNFMIIRRKALLAKHNFGIHRQTVQRMHLVRSARSTTLCDCLLYRVFGNRAIHNSVVRRWNAAPPEGALTLCHPPLAQMSTRRRSFAEAAFCARFSPALGIAHSSRWRGGTGWSLHSNVEWSTRNTLPPVNI